MGEDEDEASNENFGIILIYLDRLKKYTENNVDVEALQEFGQKAATFRHAKLQKYINMMTILTNCLTSKEICLQLLDPRNKSTLKKLGRTFEWF